MVTDNELIGTARGLVGQGGVAMPREAMGVGSGGMRVKGVSGVSDRQSAGIVNEAIKLDRLIRKKRLYFDRHSEPYYRLKTDLEVA